MGSLQQSPNNAPRFHRYPQKGPPLSLSGSETDVSTSNENLSNEEKYVIRHTARQEPQGQENQQQLLQQQQMSLSNRSSLRDSLPSNRSSLDVSSSSYNTLIIHSAGDEPWTGRNSGARESADMTQYTPTSFFHDPKLSPLQKRSTATPSPSPSSAPSVGDHQTKPTLLRNSYDCQEITDIPDDYLSQSSVLKHLLVKETNGNELLSMTSSPRCYDHAPPPHDWSDKSPLRQATAPGVVHRNKQAMKSVETKAKLSKSQPDLSRVGVAKPELVQSGFRRGVSAPRPPTKGHEAGSGGELWPSAEMVEILIKENSALKMELDNCYRRVAKTQKLEQEIHKVHKSQEELVQSCERKERLERAARGRLQNDNRRMQELNRALREQVDLLTNQMMTRAPLPADSSNTTAAECLRRELSKRDVLIAQLMQQNKEHVAVKERQEIELAAQRVTLQEQRTHIDILDTALTNAQSNVVRLEEECRKKQTYVERVAQLQRALSSLQLASDRREHTERKLRLQLERELQRTKMANVGPHGGCHGDGIGDSNGGGGMGPAGDKPGWDSPNSNSETPSELKRQLREKDEKIMQLEGECTKWEQRYLEESALRQAAIEAASVPKDAKIAALEKTSQETEKIIAEARNDKIRHMDEAHAAQKKVADLESRTKDLESKLAERDAMIRVLQKHHSATDAMLRSSPHHTPHPSLVGHGDVIDHVLVGTGVSREELVSSVLTSSTGFGSANSYASGGSDSSYVHHHHPHHHHVMSSAYGNKTSGSSFIDSNNLLDNQLKEIDSQLDSQLLSKRALCCFPGFTNPIAAQRKGKIPKPLLAGVSGGGDVPAPSHLHPHYDPNAMLLLEKQGRASQLQRNSAPSSTNESASRCPAPKPPRPLRTSALPRYNRLEGELRRKKSDGGADESSSGASSRRASPAPPTPTKLGQYGRLSESGGSSASLRKVESSGGASLRKMRSSGGSERNSASTLSDNSATSLPPPSKIRLFGGGSFKRGGSLDRRDSKASSTDSTGSKYRIQF